MRTVLLSFTAGLCALSFGQPFTAKQVTAPNALAGPAPMNFAWSPSGSVLLYDKPAGNSAILVLHDAATGHERTLFDPRSRKEPIDITSAQWSPTGEFLLLSGGNSLWVLNTKTSKAKSFAIDKLPETGQTISPDGKRVAFVRNNNLIVYELATGKEVKLTQDGGPLVYNGALDWVYEEELATRAAQPAFEWSPNSKHILYMRLDDRQVQAHPTTNFGSVPPTIEWQRYPCAGSKNPSVSLYITDLNGNEQVVPLAKDAEYVLPFFTWTPDSLGAIYMTLNREHTRLNLHSWNWQAAKDRVVLSESDQYWVNELFYSAPRFTSDGKTFLWLSERTGFFHLYRLRRDGTGGRPLTSGDWLIDPSAWVLLDPGQPFDFDEKTGWAYFSCTKNSPLERQVYRVKLDGSQLEQVTKENGTHFSLLSANGKYLVDQYSNIGTPPIISILQADGTPVRELGASAGPSLALPRLIRRFETVKAKDGTELYAQMVLPPDFDETKKYPVVVHWYGGPGLQLVTNSYGTLSLFQPIERDILYTQLGCIVWRLDNRGSFGRGHAFETPTFKKLGPIALSDQLDGIEYLKSLPYVDGTRIGCDGHSFGGFLSLFALTHAPDIFKCGVSGSPVTNWRLYDTIYTERYMRTPAENAAGYNETNLINSNLTLNVEPLIIHGLADTNVHLQNSVQFMNILMNNGKPYQFLALPNQNHDYAGTGLTECMAASAEYFARHL